MQQVTMSGDFLVAANPDEGSSLPLLVRVPLEGDGLVFATREPWPTTSRLYCHPASWPDDPDILERHAVRSCRRRGAAVDLVLDRHRLNRSQFVWTRARGRQMVFWQTSKVAKQSRPNVTLPTARASGRVLTIVRDSGERYGWRFADQQAEVVVRRLAIGDYAVEGPDGGVVAAVERKSTSDLASSLLDGSLTEQVSELVTLPFAAVVSDEGYAKLLSLPFVRGSSVLEAVAELAVRFPSVPLVFPGSRKLAQEWTYRFLGAALAHHAEDAAAGQLVAAQSGGAPHEAAPTGAAPEPTAAELRSWARSRGLAVSDRGRIPATVRAAWQAERRA